MNKNIVISIIIVIAVVGVILVLANPFKSNPSNPSPVVTQGGQKIPEFELEDFNGQKVKIASSSGKPIFIDFWAAWCPFCVNEMPEIEKIHQEFGDRLIVLGIHRSETEGTDAGAKFAKERGVTYTLLKDSTGQVYKSLTGGQQFMPYALYISKDGTIKKVKAGPKTADEIRAAVQELLQ